MFTVLHLVCCAIVNLSAIVVVMIVYIKVNGITIYERLYMCVFNLGIVLYIIMYVKGVLFDSYTS